MMRWGQMLGWFNLALLGVVAYASGAVAMQVLDQSLQAAMPPPNLAVKQQDSVQRRTRLPLTAFQPILDANIFRAKRSARDTAPVTTDQSRPVPVAAGPIDLGLELNGTVVGGRASFAMIAQTGGRNEKVYRVRECVPAGEEHPSKECTPSQGKVHSILKDHILVDYQGQRLTIKLVEESKKTPAPAAISRRPPPRPAASEEGAASGTGAPFPITQEGDQLEVRVPNAEVAAAFENFSDVLKQARVVPYTGDGYTGFQIRSIRAGSIFQRIGLRNFDVIKAVNGQPITTADQALRLLTMFRNEKEIALDLQRRNESIKLNYIIE